MNENSDCISYDAGCSINIVDLYFTASFRVSKNAGDERRHGPRIGRDDLRPLLHDATVQPVDFWIGSEALALACVQRKHHALYPLCERSFSLREASSHFFLITHGLDDQGIEEVSFGAEVAIDRRV